MIRILLYRYLLWLNDLAAQAAPAKLYKYIDPSPLTIKQNEMVSVHAVLDQHIS